MINLEKTYNHFQTDNNPIVTIHSRFDRAPFEFRSELNLDDDLFFANTQLHPTDTQPSIDLYIHPLAELSRNLPSELVDIVQDANLTEKERENKVKRFLRGKWEKDKVKEDFSHLSFYMKLWQKPDLASEAYKFGIARHRFLQTKIWNRKTKLLEAEKCFFYSKFVSMLIDGYLLWSNQAFYMAPIIYETHYLRNLHLMRQVFALSILRSSLLTEIALSLGMLFSFYMFRKGLNIERSFKKDQVESIDFEALKMTQNLPGALHYLESVRAYNHSGLIWRTTSCFPKSGKSISQKRFNNLYLNGKNVISIKKSVYRYMSQISALFWKIIYPFLLSFYHSVSNSLHLLQVAVYPLSKDV